MSYTATESPAIAPPDAPIAQPRPAGRPVRTFSSALRLPERFTAALNSWLSDSWNMFDIVGCMTLAILLLRMNAYWYIQAPLGVIALAGLIYRPLLHRAAYWFVVAGVIGAAHAFLWFWVDNHMYLLTYWCLALGLCLLAEDPAETLATNARYLIGLCFFFATLWKLITPEFVDGTFFQFALLADGRFGGVASLVADAPHGIAATHALVTNNLRAYDGTLSFVQFQEVPRVALVASVIAIWTLIIEGSIAIAFLWPRDRFISRYRDLLLSVFLITCYPIATVVGFAWLLTSMGLAQSRATPLMGRGLYIAAFLIMPLYENLPFRKLFALFIG